MGKKISMTPDMVATAIAAETGPSLVTVKNVEIVSTGTYHLASGEHTFTKSELAAAVKAWQEDPAVRPPRLKIGHESLDVLGASGEPSFGKATNLRLENDGNTILGDYVGVPEWLAEIMPAAYPSRSIEAGIGVKTATGGEHAMVITAVALLGVVAPGVSTLADLGDLYGKDMPEGVTVEASEITEADETLAAAVGSGDRVKASVDVDKIRYAYYETLPEGNWWWITTMEVDPTALIVDKDGDGLIRVPFTVSGDNITFGDPVDVEIVYAPVGEAVAASRLTASSGRPAAVFASREESRPKTTKEDQVELSEDQLKNLGLPADATQEQVDARITELAAKSEGDPPSNQPPGENENDDPTEQGPETAQPTPDGEEEQTVVPNETPEAVAAATGDGLVKVDPGTLAQLQASAAKGEQAHKQLSEKERDETITAAIGAGKFPPAREPHYKTSWDKDPEGTKALIASLPDNLVPLEARGGDVSATTQPEAYPAEWLTSSERVGSTH